MSGFNNGHDTDLIARKSDRSDRSDDDLSIPDYLDRRGEVCAQCGQAGGEEWNWLDSKVWLHSRCLEPWVDAQRRRPMSFGSDGCHGVVAMTKPSGPEWAIEATAQITAG